jgi:GT2 family glycosyltransferase
LPGENEVRNAIRERSSAPLTLGVHGLMLSMNLQSNYLAAQSLAYVGPSPSVLLICVNYGAERETKRYLESLRKLQDQSNLHVLVVDNTVDAEMSEPPTERNFTLLRAEENLGYFGGARRGLSLYLREHPLPDWVIVSNVDLVLADSQFLDKLAVLRARPRLGAVAPSIRSALTGKDQNPYLRVRPSAARMHAYKCLFQSRFVLNAYELAAVAFHWGRSVLGKLSTGAHGVSGNGPESIYAPHGSFLILSKNYFARGGDLEFPGFLFGEEIYIAERMKGLGLEVVYDPSLEVLHDEHKSTKLYKSREMAAHAAFAAAYCADVFFPIDPRS